MTDFAYGDVLKKRFILIKKLGSGASATVWLALDCKQDIFVSIKAFDKDDYDDAQYEISIYKSLTPDLNIMLHYFESHSRMCIVFPLYGGNLYDVTKNIGLDAELCNIIFNKIAGIMNSLKQCNIVHNDIKPENIMFAEPLSKPIERIINSFKDKGGIHYYIGMKKSLPNMAKCILDDILLQSDYDDTLSEAYNSSNDSNSDDSEDEFSDTSSEDLANDYDNSSTTSNNEELNNPNTKYEMDKVLESIKNGNLFLIDYGSAYNINDDDCDCIPTRYYRSPDHLQGKKHIGHKADVWSTGCSLFEINTGSILFDPPKVNNSRDIPQLQIIANTLGINNNDYQSDVNINWKSMNQDVKQNIMSLFRNYFDS